MKKSGQRKISFVLFVVAVFFAGVVLAEFHSSLWMVLAAGVVLMGASCFFIWGQEAKEQEQTTSGKTSEVLIADRMADWARSNEKAEKSVGIAVKKQQEAMTEGMSALKEKLSEVIRTQENTMKTLILYNKENAKQIALSEREELGRLCRELQKTIQTGFEAMTSKLADTSGSAEGMQRIGKELLSSLEANFQKLTEAVETTDRIPAVSGRSTVEDLISGVAMEKEPATTEEAELEMEAEPVEELVPELEMEAEPVEDLVSELEMEAEPVEDLVSELEMETEPVSEVALEEELEPMPEISVEEEPEPAPVIPEVDLSDPNKAMSADDIAALFATLGNTAEPAAAEEPEPMPEISVEEEPEPAPVIPEVDLSDPNKAMSADDIAALFAALGGAEEEPEPAPGINVEEEPEPAAEAPVIPEVDLSDPNKAMSPDDIAALFAAMGN